MDHLFIPIALFMMIFGIVYITITSRNKENMAMIESGMDPRKEFKKPHSKLRIALLMVAVPIGILVGNLIYPVFGMDPEPCAVVCSFLFGGIALVATYFIESSNEKLFEEE